MKREQISFEARIWNKFISMIWCENIFESPKALQKPVIVFWYYNAVCNGGHSAFFEDYPEISEQMLIDALKTIGAEAYVDIFCEAVTKGIEDDYARTDDAFYTQSPSLDELLQQYIVMNSNELGIFE